MNKSLPEVVLQNLMPMTFYRALDVANESGLDKNSVGSALRELYRGG